MQTSTHLNDENNLKLQAKKNGKKTQSHAEQTLESKNTPNLAHKKPGYTNCSVV